MANFEIEGTLKQKFPVQTGNSARGNWERQDFVLEFPEGNFTSQMCISAWGHDKVADLENFKVGDTVKVSFNIRAREYNGRWYNDIRAWRISSSAPSSTQQSVPAYAQSSQGPSAPVPSIDDMPADDSSLDDLPF